MRTHQKKSLKDKKSTTGGLKQGVVGYSKKTALLEEAITQMNVGKYGRSSAALKELLALDPHNMEARRLFATLHLRLGSLIPARQAFDSLIDEAFQRQDYWLAESLLREYLESGPRCVPYREKLGSIYQDKGEALEAVAEYGKAIDILIEDPDSDNPNHACQLYEKIKSLAPTSPVAVRLADCFDAQTGELIARPPVAAAQESPVATDAPASPMASEPIAGTMPQEQSGNSSPVQESAVAPYLPDMQVDASALPKPEEAHSDASPLSGSLVNGYGAIDLGPEPIPASSGDSAPLAVQQFTAPDSLPQETQQETAGQAVPAPMPWEDVREATVSIPDQTVTESPAALSSAPAPDQTAAGSFQETAKGGDFSWDSVFKNIWNPGSTPPASTPMPEPVQSGTMPVEEPPVSTISPAYVQEVEPGTIEIPEAARRASLADSAAAPPGAAPMPWDQVADSAIAIPQAQTEETVAEPPVEQTAPSANQMEPVAWSYQEPVQEQDRPLAVVQQTDHAPETAAFSIIQPSPAPSAFETESVPTGLASDLSVTNDQIAGAATEQQPYTFSYAGEQPKPVEPAAFESASASTDIAPPAGEAVPPQTQYESISFSFKEEPVGSGSAAHAGVLESVVAPEPVSSGTAEEPSPWKTDEAAVQTDRPSSIKQQKAEEPVWEIPRSPALSEETAQRRTEEEEWRKPAFTETKAALPESAPKPEKSIKAEESIRFVEEPPVSPVAEAMPQAPIWGEQRTASPASVASAAVDVLYESSGHLTQTETKERPAPSRPRPKLGSKASRIGVAISDFVGSCFSTTRAIVMSLVGLVVLSCALAALGIGAVALTWVIMEESPSSTFQSLTAGPQQRLSDSNKNGYLLLLGFDAPSEQDPIRTGYERKSDGKDVDRVSACLGGVGDGAQAGQANASAKVLSGWFRGSNPVGQFTSHRGTISGWAGQGASMLGRYGQWQRLSFEDWGYGQAVAPPCASINLAHHLYVADGFVQGTDIGIDRIEKDMEAWRMVLGQAKTIPMKALALQAINDDAAVASGLLAQPDFDGAYLGRLAKILRPLDQAELSLRWPMQSELAYAARTFDAQLKAEKGEGQAVHAAIASALPLPKQRRLNDYAEYYEAFAKAAVEGRYSALPKSSSYTRSPANTFADYFANPIENIVGLEPLPSWDLYNGLVVDTDAHLRLASLQAWIRRGPPDADLLPRIAKAGQNFYDPYTGLPMLVNKKKGVLYSVGHDGKDQDADSQHDVVVAIPANPVAVPAKSPPGPSKSK